MMCCQLGQNSYYNRITPFASERSERAEIFQFLMKGIFDKMVKLRNSEIFQRKMGTILKAREIEASELKFFDFVLKNII